MDAVEQEDEKLHFKVKARYHWEKIPNYQWYHCSPHGINWALRTKRSDSGLFRVIIYRNGAPLYKTKPVESDDFPEVLQLALDKAEEEIDNEVCHTDYGDFIIID